MREKKRREKRIRHANMLHSKAYPCLLDFATGRRGRA